MLRLRLGRGPQDGGRRLPAPRARPWWRPSPPSKPCSAMRARPRRRRSRCRSPPTTVTTSRRWLEACYPRTGLVYVCNPNNPTGTIVSGAELQAFLHKACRRTRSCWWTRPTTTSSRTRAIASAFECCPSTRTWWWCAPSPRSTASPGMRLGYAVGLQGEGRGDARPGHLEQRQRGRARGRARHAWPNPSTSRRPLAIDGTRRWLVAELEKEGRRTMPSETNFVMIHVGPRRGAARRRLQGPGASRWAAASPPCRTGCASPSGPTRRPVPSSRPCASSSPSGPPERPLKRLLILAAAGLFGLAAWVWVGLPSREEVRALAHEDSRPDRAHAAARGGGAGEEAEGADVQTSVALVARLPLPHPGRDRLGGPEVLRPRGHRLAGHPGVGSRRT